MKKNLDSYSETLFHLINFRNRQFRDSRSMIGIDYESFIIISTIGAHYLTHNTKQGSNWDSVWENTRQKKIVYDSDNPNLSNLPKIIYNV